MNENKRGRILLGYNFLMDNPETVLRLFKEIGFLPMRINHDMIADTVEYAGYSESFRELHAGEVVPHYWLRVQAGEHGEIEKCWVEETKE